MRTIAVIPARYHSTRFEAKVLAIIDGKPMIQHVYERTRQSQRVDDVIIACDHPDVQQAAEAFGARAVMTDPNHASGSDRIAEAVKNISCDVVVNVQGDEPLIQPQVIDALVDAMSGKDNHVMATVVTAIRDDAEIDDPNVVKAVINAKGEALYFSRSRIPYQRNAVGQIYYKHLGIYAYTREFLLTYTQMPKSKLELTESLEQLRVLDAGYRIKTIETDQSSIGVDCPEDLVKVEAAIRKQES